MDNNNIKNTFNRFRKSPPGYTLSEDFEGRVFAKIKKKKTQRKAAASAVLAIVVFAFIFVAQAIFSHREPERTILMARPDAVIETKEEIPVMEDVIFASSDRQTNYAIEQVAYYEDEDTI